MAGSGLTNQAVGVSEEASIVAVVRLSGEDISML